MISSRSFEISGTGCGEEIVRDLSLDRILVLLVLYLF